MEIPKLIILLSCTYCCLASEHSHTIPVEEYETELQDLGQHVETPETPIKVIKITKTIAVKIPVPYPVKVIEKVPYPVHVSKPYPVPVPQIIHVPHGKSHQGHEPIDGTHGAFQNTKKLGSHDGQSYQVHEGPSFESHTNDEHSFGPSQESESYGGDSKQGFNFGAVGGDHSYEGSYGNSYDAPVNYYGYSGDSEGHGSVESKTYDQAISDYLRIHHPSGNSHSSGRNGNHQH